MYSEREIPKIVYFRVNIMRKYYQLLLFLLSAVSILCFVFYKHEYDRLKKVLEVLDFFGTPVTENEKAKVIEEVNSNRSIEFIPDFWHKYGDNIEVYSAFQITSEKAWSLNSVAVVKKNSSSLKHSSCALISGDVTDDKFEGTIEWRQIESDNISVAYAITCNVPEMIGNSHLFSLYDNKKTAHTLNFPLHLGPTQLKDHAVSMCVLSDEPYWHAGDMVDFLLYYTFLGVDNFYLYHRGIGDQVISALKELLLIRKNMTIHLATWNIPSSPSASFNFALVNQDCFWRHSAKTGPVITLQFGQFLGLSKAIGMKDFLNQYRFHSSNEAQMHLETMCHNASSTEFSTIKFSPSATSKSKQIQSGFLRWVNAPNHPSKSETIKVDNRVAKLYTFESCSTLEIERVQEDPILRRFNEIVRNIPQFNNLRN